MSSSDEEGFVIDLTEDDPYIKDYDKLSEEDKKAADDKLKAKLMKLGLVALRMLKRIRENGIRSEAHALATMNAARDIMNEISRMVYRASHECPARGVLLSADLDFARMIYAILSL